MFPVLLKISHFFYHPIYREGDNEDYTPLCELVEQSQHLQCFGINVHTREDNSPLRLLNAISKSNIESLRFQHCSVTRFFLKDVANMIKSMKCLKKLQLTTAHEFKDDAWQSFCASLENSKLEKFEFEENRLSDKQMGLALQSLKNQKHLKKFYFALILKEDVVCHLAPLLRQLKHAMFRLYLLNTQKSKEEIFFSFSKEVANSQSLRFFDCLINMGFTSFTVSDAFATIQDVVSTNPNLIGYYDNRRRFRNDKDLYLDDTCFKRNKQNLELATAGSQTLLAIKRFRKSDKLQTLGRDMSTMLAQYLFLTWTDIESWSNIETVCKKRQKLDE